VTDTRRNLIAARADAIFVSGRLLAEVIDDPLLTGGATYLGRPAQAAVSEAVT
jgi:hypothetical protein